MAVSSYQVQRLITRLRRLRGAQSADTGATAGPAAPGGSAVAVRVQLSERARQQAAEAAASLRLPAGAPVSVVTIVDATPLAAETLRELERRAGSFMRPPPEPAAGPAPFPRARRPFPPTGEPEPFSGEDLPEGW
jgi:hypothetical protein